MRAENVVYFKYGTHYGSRSGLPYYNLNSSLIHRALQTATNSDEVLYRNNIRVTRFLVLCVCFVDRCLSFCTFSFGHCVVCYSSNTDSDYPFVIFKLFLQICFYLPHNIFLALMNRFRRVIEKVNNLFTVMCNHSKGAFIKEDAYYIQVNNS